MGTSVRKSHLARSTASGGIGVRFNTHIAGSPPGVLNDASIGSSSPRRSSSSTREMNSRSESHNATKSGGFGGLELKGVRWS